MSLAYYPSEGTINKVHINENKEWFGKSTGGKIITEIKSYIFNDSKNYFDIIDANLLHQTQLKWFFGSFSDFHFLNGKSIYRCLYIGNNGNSNLIVGNISSNIFSNLSIVNSEINNIINIEFASDGIFQKTKTENTTALLREDDPEDIFKNRNDWSSSLNLFDVLPPGHFYKIWIKVSFIHNQSSFNVLPDNFLFFIQIKDLIFPCEKTTGRLSLARIFRTNLYSELEKKENDFIFRHFLNANVENKIGSIEKIIDHNNLIYIFYWHSENESFNVYIIKPNDDINKVKIININISNYLKNIIKNKTHFYTEYVCNYDENGNLVHSNIQQNPVYDLINSEKIYKKYFTNVFLSNISNERIFYIFYNQYILQQPEHTSIRNVGYERYYLSSFVSILNLNHITEEFFDKIFEFSTTNLQDIHILSPPTYILKEKFAIRSIIFQEDLFSGIGFSNETCDSKKPIARIFFMWEKDLLLAKEDKLQIYYVPSVTTNTFNGIKNKTNSDIDLIFNEKNANLVSNHFYRTLFNFDDDKKYKFISLGPPHLKSFNHGLSEVTFDWNETHSNEFCTTWSFGISPRSVSFTNEELNPQCSGTSEIISLSIEQNPFVENDENEHNENENNHTQTVEINCWYNNPLYKNEIKNIFVFYNNSYYDDFTEKPTIKDFNAIDTQIQPLFPGSYAKKQHITNYDKGINGIFIDVLTVEDYISVSDFEFYVGNSQNISTWIGAPQPKYINVYDIYDNNVKIKRISIIWDDFSIVNNWLKVVIKANNTTKLSHPFVFYLGNFVGCINYTQAPPDLNFIVTQNDLNTLLQQIGSPNTSTPSIFDINKDGLIDNNDKHILETILSNYSIPLYNHHLVFLDVTDDISLLPINVPENTLLYEFDENNPNHWHLQQQYHFNALVNKRLKLPHPHYSFLFKDEFIPIFSINCLYNKNDPILKASYNFSQYKWKIEYINQQNEPTILYKEQKNFFITCENVISVNLFSKPIFECNNNRLFDIHIIINDEQIFYDIALTKNLNSQISIIHNCDNAFAGWVSFWEVRKYMNNEFTNYAHLMHRIYSNIAWFKLEPEYENINTTEHTTKYLFKRKLSLQNCKKYLHNESLIVPLVLQGSGYNLSKSVNLQIRRSVFDFTKININDINFYFSYDDNEQTPIEWVADSYNIQKDILVIWLKLTNWTGQKIIMYYTSPIEDIQYQDRPIPFFDSNWYAIWDSSFGTYVKKRYTSGEIFDTGQQTLVLEDIKDEEKNHYLLEIQKTYLFGSKSVYKHHMFDLLIDEKHIDIQNLIRINEFIRENIKLIKPAHTELRNINSIYNYKLEANDNNMKVRWKSEDDNIVTPESGFLPLCQ